MHRFLGSNTDFDSLNNLLEKDTGEVLVAHWLHDPLNNPNVAIVKDESHFNTLVAKAKAGYYNELKFFATTDFTENPYAYEEPQGPATGTQSNNTPTVEELATKASDASVIDADFAKDLRACEDLEEALGMFYSYVIQEDKGDPEQLLKKWDIIK